MFSLYVFFLFEILHIALTSAIDFNESQDIKQMNPLNFSLLNRQEQIKIPLDGYFPFSQSYSTYQKQSSPNVSKIFNITFNLDKIHVQQSQKMTNNLNGQQIDLSKSRILDVKTIYNQPNKIFLLESNIIMMYSYRQRTQSEYFKDQKAEFIFKNKYPQGQQDDPNITLFNISDAVNLKLKNYTFNCVQTQAFPYEGTYKLAILCKAATNAAPQTRNYIVVLNLKQDNRGFITKMQYNDSNYIQNNDRNSFLNRLYVLSQGNFGYYSEKSQLNGPQNCQQYHLKYFEKIIIEQRMYNQTVIVYCNKSGEYTSIKEVYDISFRNGKVFIGISSNPDGMNINMCLWNSRYVTEYQNGFIAIRAIFFKLQLSLRVYKYNHKVLKNGKYETNCSQYSLENLIGYMFITSRNLSGVQTMYVIFPYQIMIFESYSPNYQTLKINNQGLKLKSYAITNEILFLHYEDQQNTKLVIMSYNIKAMYPHLIDKVQYSIGKSTGIYLFSVMNYLQTGNYFFIYQRDRNLLNLTFYDGQFMTIKIIDPAKSVGLQKISIVNSTELNPSQNDTAILPIYLKIRAFCDTSIEIEELEEIKVNQKYFNIDLVKAIIGPLGRFYKMTNRSSQLQFVNSFHQIDITDILNKFGNKKLMTFSINTFLNVPMLSFYFQSFFFLNCDLQFDYKMMRPIITRCIQITETQIDKKPDQILIYEQGKFIQHEGHQIQFCRISTNQQIICVQEADFQEDTILKMKLIKYQAIDDNLEFISVFIIFQHKFKQKDYILKSNATSVDDIQVFSNVEITKNEIDYLKNMSIRTVEYDQGYQNFLLVYMIEKDNSNESKKLNCFQPNTQECNNLEQSNLQIIQVYSKPQLQRNQSSHFAGHLIAEFRSTELQNVFIIDNKILMLLNTTFGSTIEEFMIENFKCIKNRNYPLYDHSIAKNGSHFINSGFLFVEVQQLERQISKYLVYNPSLSTTNILTHSFQKIPGQHIYFTQKITPSPNVMSIHGTKLLTLSLPNMVIKLNQANKQIQKSSQSPKIEDKFNKIAKIQEKLQLVNNLKISFIDSNDILKILKFQYSYDITDSKIQYNHDIPTTIHFNEYSSFHEILINPSNITGPVSEYSIENVTANVLPSSEQSLNDVCSFVEVNSSDIFTKTRCIKYFNSKQDGIMQDFLTYETGLFEDLSIIVTDTKILCIQNMKIQNSKPKNKTKDCNIFQEDSRIFIVCTQNNNTVMNMLQMMQKCQFQVVPLQKPDFLKYNIFKMVYSRGQALFQVPIRSETNKVYYVTRFFIQNNTFEQSALLLKHQSQEEFITKDFTTDDTFLFLLQNGLGIYNLSNRKSQNSSKLTPAVWIQSQVLEDKFDLNEQFTYVNCLDLDYVDSSIILEIGTTLHSYEIHISYQLINQSFTITEMHVHYIYKNPESCYNTLLSKSRYYKNMTIKMCSFMPQQHFIFSNFIPISQNKQNSYIIFYQKNFEKNWSYPFRMDIIYTNIYSNDNFQIPMQKANLLIGSLFNLLCQYDLKDKFMFNFTINKKKLKDYINDTENVDLSAKCHFVLNLSNQNYYQPYNITIQVDLEDDGNMFWTDWKHWIQRIFFVVVAVNFVRLQLKKRAEAKRLNPLKTKISRSDSFDQDFDTQVRFLSKKSI